MNPLVGAALVSGASSLLGGGLSFLGGQSANAQNAAIAQQQMQMQQQQFDQQMAFAREQMFTGQSADIYQRMQAAHDYGISPLTMLGAPSYSPGAVPAGDITGGGGNAVNALSGTTQALSAGGQDISRAMMAAKTPEERAILDAKVKEITGGARVQDATINELNARANYYNNAAQRQAGMLGPGMQGVQRDAGGQGDTGIFKVEPAQVVSSAPSNRGAEAGPAKPAIEWRATADGGVVPYAAAGSPAAQGDIFESAINFGKNRLGPMFGIPSGPNESSIWAAVKSAYPGAIGYYMGSLGQYYPRYPNDGMKESGSERDRRMRGVYR